jgi:hypothetical protein
MKPCAERRYARAKARRGDLDHARRQHPLQREQRAEHDRDDDVLRTRVVTVFANAGTVASIQP